MTRRREGGGAAALPLLILLLAAGLRFAALGTVPLGLHGDEAITGIDARRALRDGWLGPYLYPSALGQPSGPVYVAAAALGLCGESTAVLRGSMALFGVASVGFTYLAGRAMFGRVVGLAAAALLVALPWHLHLSRTAFMVNAWPALQMAALWLLFRARRVRARGAGAAGRFALFGVVAGLGLYTYNAYPLSLPVLAVPFVCDLLRPAAGLTRRRAWRDALLAAAVIVAMALPMAEYARTHEEYFWHQEEVGVFFTPAWREADWPARAALLAARGAEWGRGVLFGGRRDDGDGLAERGYPLLDPLSIALLAAGVLLAARRWREPAAATLLAGCLVLPWGALLTIEDGLYRRTYALVPILALLAALPLARAWRAAATRRWRPLAAALIVALLVASAARNAWRYFGPLQDSEQMRYVFPYQADAAARFIAALPAGARVYWYSDRWPASFETLRWHAPNADVVERASHFGVTAPDGSPMLGIDGGHPAVVMLLGRYQSLADTWQSGLPGGEWYTAQRGDEVLYRAYVLP
ncbi:MAG: glycosyltransferase family 39 protein [Deltaproteobacteria bacterium]|nr:glycosyltransferase family 39 protein [Deltaproteobacteria bacterium]